MERHESIPDGVVKVGSTQPRSELEEISHDMPDGRRVVINTFSDVSGQDDIHEANMQITDPETGVSELWVGRIKGKIIETGKYTWEHKKIALGVLTVGVTIGTLLVRHKRR